jgi:protein-tyrosine phosphatase
MSESSIKSHLPIPFIDQRFGTWRGLARLLHAWLYLGSGRLATYGRVDMTRVKRFVFVCHGNICRSAYAHGVARALQLPSASFGLSTQSGGKANPRASVNARRLGVDLSDHVVTAIDDFVFHDGDLLLAMEVQQARKLASMNVGQDLQVSLLGLWMRPPRPHLHDPFELDNQYFQHCFRLVDEAVRALAAEWRRSES